jgi:hypothetical protein
MTEQQTRAAGIGSHNLGRHTPRIARAWFGQSRTQALLFLQKKKQKNSFSLGVVLPPVKNPPGNKSFLVLFFKKERLASLPA